MSKKFHPFFSSSNLLCYAPPCHISLYSPGGPSYKCHFGGLYRAEEGDPAATQSRCLSGFPQDFIDFPELLICISYDTEDKIVHGCASSQDH